MDGIHHCGIRLKREQKEPKKDRKDNLRENTVNDVTKNIKVDINDFGVMAVSAIQYCLGRQTYMPSTIRMILHPYLIDLPIQYINKLRDICRFQKEHDLYGDELADKPGWLKWEQDLKDLMKMEAAFSEKPENIEITDDNRNFGLLVICAIRCAASADDISEAEKTVDACVRYLPQLNGINIDVCCQDLSYFDSFDLSDAWRKTAKDEGRVAEMFHRKWYPAVLNEKSRRESALDF